LALGPFDRTESIIEATRDDTNSGRYASVFDPCACAKIKSDDDIRKRQLLSIVKNPVNVAPS